MNPLSPATARDAAQPALRLGIGLQALLLLAVGLLSFAPPERGLMLLVPVTPAAARHLASQADAAGAQIAGIGPFPGSRYVIADRRRLMPLAMSKGMILLSGRPRLCGGLSGTQADD